MTLLSLASWFTIEARDFENIRFDAAARGTLRDVILAVCFGIVLATLYGAYQRRVAGAPLRALLKKEAFSKESAVTLEELGLDGNIFILWELRKNQTLRRLVRAVASTPAKIEKGTGNGQNSGESEAAEPADESEIAAKVEKKGDAAMLQSEAASATANEADAEDSSKVGAPTSKTAKEADKTPEGVELPRTIDELLDARLYIPEHLKYRAELRFSKEGTGPVGLAVTVGLTLVLAILLIKLMPAILGVVDKFL